MDEKEYWRRFREAQALARRRAMSKYTYVPNWVVPQGESSESVRSPDKGRSLRYSGFRIWLVLLVALAALAVLCRGLSLF